MLLSRVAENLYWAARNLERAEDTARIVLRHTDLLVDLPTTVPLNWDPLLAITGTESAFQSSGHELGETTIVSYLIMDRTNSGSVSMCVAAARENLRTTREVIPREAWQVVNDLHLYVLARHDEGVLRATRHRYLQHVISQCQGLIGVLAGTMNRDYAYTVMRLGRNIERADMTTRVLDTVAGELLNGDSAHDDIQWASVLKQLSALQMYRRSVRTAVGADAVVQFCLRDRAFPRAVAHCLDEVASCLDRLPQTPSARAACESARTQLDSAKLDGLTTVGLHELADQLQINIGKIHDCVDDAFFSAHL